MRFIYAPCTTRLFQKEDCKDSQKISQIFRPVYGLFSKAKDSPYTHYMKDEGYSIH